MFFVLLDEASRGVEQFQRVFSVGLSSDRFNTFQVPIDARALIEIDHETVIEVESVTSGIKRVPFSQMPLAHDSRCVAGCFQ